MAVSVEMQHTGCVPAVRAEITAFIEHALADRPGDWRVSIILLPRPYVVAACALVGVAGQLLAPVYSLAWVAALLLNVGVAIYLAILLNLSS